MSMKSPLIAQAEIDLAHAQRDYQTKAVAARAARAKVDAAARRLGELQFKATEVEMEFDRERKERERGSLRP